jgi:hypothetical protein
MPLTGERQQQNEVWKAVRNLPVISMMTGKMLCDTAILSEPFILATSDPA